MTTFRAQTRRNIKLFFCDKGMFLTSMATPLILILLFVTFLGEVYRSSFLSAVPEGITVPAPLTEAFVGGFLFSSLLAVCTVTVSFCSNLLMVQDKANGTRDDLEVSPLPPSTMALSYYVASAISTLLVCLTALLVCFVYLGVKGWYLTVGDVLGTLVTVILLVLFGTSLSSILGSFMTTQGQISAVGSIVSSAYGFLCGAYMPISQFGQGIQIAISFLPGTYGTSLLHHHLMRGALSRLEQSYLPTEAVEELRTVFDAELFFFSHPVPTPVKYLILGGAVLLLTLLYIALCRRKRR